MTKRTMLDGLPVEQDDNGDFQAVVTDALAAGTREYDFDQATLTAVGATSVRRAIGTLNANREIMITATVDCYVRFGDSNVTVAASDEPALRMFATDRFHLRVKEGVTHYAVIQNAASGDLRVTPVA